MYLIVRLSASNRILRRCHSVYAADTIFQSENIKKAIKKFARMQSVRTQAQTPTKNAAVLIPLCVVDDRVSLLYTLRAANLKSHRGQVSFPGGMEDSSDPSPEHTAVRETQEELGIGPNQIEVWGCGSAVVSSTLTSVLPVVGVLKIRNWRKELKINQSEVKEVFTVPLEVLCDPLHIRHTQFRSNYSLPVYTGGKRRIWGLTAIITHLFLKSLMPRDAYDPIIKYIPSFKGSLPYRLL